jgi:outer membrane protein assembly factor BamB
MLPTLDNEGDIEWGSSPTVVRTPSGRKIVVATGKDGILYALQASDLSLVYTVRLAIQCICPECGCGSVSTPAYDGRYLYVGAGVSDPDLFEDGSIYALDPDTGNIVWGGPIFGTIIAPVTVANGLVYASTMDGLKIFNSDTGEMVFADEGRGGLFSQPVVTGGNVYCTFFRGYSSAYHIDEEAVAPPPEETASSRNR